MELAEAALTVALTGGLTSAGAVTRVLLTASGGEWLLAVTVAVADGVNLRRRFLIFDLVFFGLTVRRRLRPLNPLATHGASSSPM